MKFRGKGQILRLSSIFRGPRKTVGPNDNVHWTAQATLVPRPARHTEPTFCSIWAALSAIGASNEFNVQWIPAHVGLEGNAAANQEAKRGSMLPQSSAPMDLTSATEALKWHQRSIAENRYLSDPHARVHTAFTNSQHCYQRRHHIGRPDSAICPHCQGAEETVEHLVFQCPAHDQARNDTWPGNSFTTDPQRL